MLHGTYPPHGHPPCSAQCSACLCCVMRCRPAVWPLCPCPRSRAPWRRVSFGCRTAGTAPLPPPPPPTPGTPAALRSAAHVRRNGVRRRREGDHEEGPGPEVRAPQERRKAAPRSVRGDAQPRRGVSKPWTRGRRRRPGPPPRSRAEAGCVVGPGQGRWHVSVSAKLPHGRHPFNSPWPGLTRRRIASIRADPAPKKTGPTWAPGLSLPGQGWNGTGTGPSEVAPEAVRQAVGGGCQSGWGAVTVGYKCH